MQNLYLTDEDVALIRTYAGEAELSGKLTRQQLALAFDRGWFKALVPATAGGSELSLPAAMSLLESAGRADGSFGWTLNLGAGANMFAGFLDSDTAIRLFADKFITIAGSGSVSGTAERSADGYIIDGSWKYATGSAHAKFLSGSCVITEGNVALKSDDGSPLTRSFLVPKEQVKISGSWTGHGMRASSTRDYSIKNVWIPKELSFSLCEPVSPGTLYKFPFLQLAEVLLSATLTGIASHFLEEVKKNISDKFRAGGTRELMHAEKLIGETSLSLHQAVSRVWNMLKAGENPTGGDYADISRQARNAAQRCRMEAARLYPLAGMFALDEHSSINRAWRDLHTASQHTLLFPGF